MRDDGRQPATKADLNAFATKADLSAFATKEAIRDEFRSFRAEIHEMFRPIAITLAHHTVELADIRGHIKDKMVTRDEFHSRMDAFAGRVADFDYSSAKNRSRLDDHEKRIASLEEKRA